MRPPWAGPSLLDRVLAYLGLTTTASAERARRDDRQTIGQPPPSHSTIAGELDRVAQEVARLARRVAELERDLQARHRP